MTDHVSPSSPEPTPDDLVERQADLRALAEAARAASEALGRFSDLARLTRHDLDGSLGDVDQLAEDCQGWALGFAFGAGATDLAEEWTARPWRQS